MTSRSDPRVLVVAAALVDIFDALGQSELPATGDELVAFPFGLERRAASALVREGKIATSRIGRRHYARRSALLALVPDRVAPPAKLSAGATSPTDAARASYAAGVLRVVRAGGR